MGEFLGTILLAVVLGVIGFRSIIRRSITFSVRENKTEYAKSAFKLTLTNYLSVIFGIANIIATLIIVAFSIYAYLPANAHLKSAIATVDFVAAISIVLVFILLTVFQHIENIQSPRKEKAVVRRIIMIRGVDYIGVGVGAIIVNDEGKLLLAKRGPKARNERGLWEFPGGAVEFGDTLRDSLIREIKEEYGVTIAVGDLLTVTDHILPEENQHWVSPSYICRVVEGEPTILEPEKCSMIGWFALDEIPNDLTKVTAHDLVLYREYVERSSNPK
jgi:8-oxo-dGTP diphosphatase